MEQTGSKCTVLTKVEEGERNKRSQRTDPPLSLLPLLLLFCCVSKEEGEGADCATYRLTFGHRGEEGQARWKLSE